eukprot:CAMPEP_0204062888 /NCGR_PEP_ID=MMETSP0360-20130528/145252_1 /ASSEMBLY_ACC=CAM_ASM_000342 /TAXON_ID=268821 /ORGANISM="Scrippsiella Hangoei, Strain SHTV-5" /LENGTH=58 /DNA_ID=CAMNT_0051010697 /DNA_START=72 /DNA_END=248 /DNA_ORIENTATION=-
MTSKGGGMSGLIGIMRIFGFNGAPVNKYSTAWQLCTAGCKKKTSGEGSFAWRHMKSIL